jgi:hypothetical protein
MTILLDADVSDRGDAGDRNPSTESRREAVRHLSKVSPFILRCPRCDGNNGVVFAPMDGVRATIAI